MPMIHNRGRQIGDKFVSRKIVFPKGWDSEGNPIKEEGKTASEVILPNQHKDVTAEQLTHLKKIFGNEIVNLDDIRDMQAQFKPGEAQKPREGYLSPEEVEKRVQERLQEELAKRAETSETEPSLEVMLDKMDRGDIIALIEKEGLDIDRKKYKAPQALKAAVLTAVENKKAAGATGAEE